MKHHGYHTRALKAQDPRFARAFERMGYRTADLSADDTPPVDMPALRAEYEQVVGKRPFNGWDQATLLEKIAEAKRA